ncbi:MAG: GTPase Era [Rickettsiales bacterium]|jgi:GTP-binding protein Era|nr:GTPase Era [Rickettsiales bacterium]
MTEQTPPSIPQDKQRCTFVALVGAPNAGKSTLLNQLVGSKISIVSPKVQTTRTLIKGIAMEGDAQIVFVDTPGIFTPRNDRRLERAIVHAAWTGMGEADTIIVLIDAKRKIDDNTQLIIKSLRERKQKAWLVLNKIDLVEKSTLLALAQELNDTGVFDEIFMVSAMKGDGVADLRKSLAAKAPLGPWMYDEDQVSTAPLRFLAAEVTREKLFFALDQELPYALSVETEQWEERNESVKIHQVIYVEREAHKRILIGKNGEGIKRIGEQSRKELSYMLEKTVHLFLFVKVRPNWLESPEMYQNMGLDFV